MTRDHLPFDSHNVNHTAHASRQARSTSHTVNHGRYLPVRIAGRVGATTRAFPCRSTRRAGHLHRRVTRQPGHTIFPPKAATRRLGARSLLLGAKRRRRRDPRLRAPCVVGSHQRQSRARPPDRGSLALGCGGLTGVRKCCRRLSAANSSSMSIFLCLVRAAAGWAPTWFTRAGR